MEQQLPLEMMQHITSYLDTANLGRVLADATPTDADAPHWSDEAPKWSTAVHQQMKTLDNACRTVIEQAETKAWGLPGIDDTRFGRSVAAAIDREQFPHLARLLTLQQVRAGLESVRTDAADDAAYPVPDLMLGAFCKMVHAPGEAPMFAGHAATSDEFQVRIVFCTQGGEIGSPSLLEGAIIAKAWRGGPGPELLVEFEDGRLAVYRHDTNELDVLPAEFENASAVDLSRNGRFVAAFGEVGALLVYDRTSKALVVDDAIATRPHPELSIDNAGNVVVLRHPAFVGQGPMQYTLGARSWAPLDGRLAADATTIRLCPNDRYLAKSLDWNNLHRLVLVDRQLPDQAGIELLQTAQTTHGVRMAYRLVFSPGNALVAVAYANGTVDLFDLAGAAGRSPAIIEAKRTLTLPRDLRSHTVGMAFSHDGASFHVSGADGSFDDPAARFLRFDLL